MTGQVTLRPVAEDDLPFLARMRGDPAAAGEYGWFGWSGHDHDRRRWAESGLADDRGGTLIVCRDGDRAGSVSWRTVSAGPIASAWNIGIGLLPEFRGRGTGSSAQRQLAQYLFAHTQAHRVEASTETTNIAEQRALEKAGFTREGVLREAMFRLGHWRDLVSYSVLRGEVTL